ncbi:MAG: helix-turn-helix transcriptional regulator [Rhodoblastus sp.]|nr:MAG: helix-turn-helix transcriptional regulator [Rhodoblastus sp.]
MLGVSYQQVQKYEKGQDHLKAIQIKTLCERLDAPLSYFFGGSPTHGLAEEGVAFEGAGSAATAQAHDLMQCFLSIRSQATRDAVVELARRLAEAESTPRSL